MFLSESFGFGAREWTKWFSTSFYELYMFEFLDLINLKFGVSFDFFNRSRLPCSLIMALEKSREVSSETKKSSLEA